MYGQALAQELSRRRASRNRSGAIHLAQSAARRRLQNKRIQAIFSLHGPLHALPGTVKVFGVKNDPALTKDDISAYRRQHLTGYKRQKFIELRDALPKTNVGKILRRELRAAV